MCGIVGIFRQGNHDDSGVTNQALGVLAHRGPDDRGVWWTKRHDDTPFSLSLGHVRLAILDLSANGHQPMVAADGLTIVFNGEIYNFIELRAELTAQGHEFHTDTDTEVVLAAYRQWGESCVEHFIGMWALAIWTGSRLFLSRDRLGKKPLYYHHDPTRGVLAFASEIKALRCLPGVPWEPDEETVFRFLAFAEMEHGGATFFRDIREFPAAGLAHCDDPHQPLEVHRFWTLSCQEQDIAEPEAIRTTTELLHDSLRLRLRSDAPLGLSLSGGLDSTLLLALLNEAGTRPAVFSAGYEEPGYSESHYIRIATEQLACNPHATLSSVDLFRQDFQKLIYHLDQPCKLPGPYSQWRVVDLASRHVKVLLDGQGVDELAGGYLYFLPLSWRESPWLERLRQAPDLALTLWGNRHMLQQYSLPLIWERVRGRATRGLPKHLCHDWATSYSGLRPRWESPSETDLNAALRSAVLETSLPALLRYGDRVTMAFGVENRSPFLDHRLLDFVAALPIHYKIRGGTTKWIFRAVAKGRVPEAIQRRRMKMGFPTPVGVWLRGELLGDARGWLADYETLDWFRRWIDTAAVRRLLDDHAAGRGEHQALLWRVLSLGAWLKCSGDFA